MPKPKQTEEQKEAEYANWCNSEEAVACDGLRGEFQKRKVDNGFVDVSDDFQPMLNKLFEVVQLMKVPGRKAKSKFQQFLMSI